MSVLMLRQISVLNSLCTQNHWHSLHTNNHLHGSDAWFNMMCSINVFLGTKPLCFSWLYHKKTIWRILIMKRLYSWCIKSHHSFLATLRKINTVIASQNTSWYYKIFQNLKKKNHNPSFDPFIYAHASSWCEFPEASAGGQE